MGCGAVVLIVASLLSTQLLTLDECIDIALEQNLTLKELEEELRVATSEYRSSWSNFLPNLSVSGGYSRYRSENPWPGGFYTFEDTSWSTTLHLTQILFDSDKFALSGQLKGHREVLESEYREEKLSVSLKVKEAYYSLLRAKKLLEVSETRVKESETNLEKTEELHKLGSASRAELLKARVNLLESRLELTGAEKNVEIAKSNLLVILGLGPSEEIRVKEDSVPPDRWELEIEDIPTFESALELTRLYNPKLRRAEANLKLAKTDLYAAYGSYLPKFSLSAHYGYEGSSLFPLREAWDSGRKSWQFGFSISLPIFTGFQRFLTVDKARANCRSAEYYRRIVERDLLLELKNCYLDIKESKERLKLAEENLQLAKESYQAAKERYNLGVAPILELIDAELSLVKAESTRIEALYDCRLAIERLKTIVGKEDL